MIKHLMTTAAALAVFLTSGASGETFIYKTILGKDTGSTVFSIEDCENGKKAVAEYHTGSGVSFSEVTMTESFSTRSWKYTGGRGKINIDGTLSHDTVLLKGTKKSKPIDKVFPLKSVVWRQMFPFDLKEFVLSNKETTCFCGVSTIALGNLQMGILDVKKIGLEKIVLHGKEAELLHVKVSHQSLGLIVWHGDYWYSKDGTLRKSASFDIPGMPPVVTVLEKTMASPMVVKRKIN